MEKDSTAVIALAVQAATATPQKTEDGDSQDSGKAIVSAMLTGDEDSFAEGDRLGSMPEDANGALALGNAAGAAGAVTEAEFTDNEDVFMEGKGAVSMQEDAVSALALGDASEASALAPRNATGAMHAEALADQGSADNCARGEWTRGGVCARAQGEQAKGGTHALA